jgi:hypothetical protein
MGVLWFARPGIPLGSRCPGVGLWRVFLSGVQESKGVDPIAGEARSEAGQLRS